MEILKKTPLLVEVICLHVRINKLVKGKIVSYNSYKPKTNKKKERNVPVNKSQKSYLNYITRAIITRGLYTFYPIFEGQKHFLRSFFRKFLTLCKVSIQERLTVVRVRYVHIKLGLFINRDMKIFRKGF